MHCNSVDEFIEYLKKNSFMFSEERRQLLEKISTAQHPFMTLLTCSDSRVDIEYFKMDPLDKVFVIRNIGNAVLSNEGSLEYGIRHLKTPILFILGHTNCGAVKAALKDYHKCEISIKRELNNIEPAIVGIDKDLDFTKKWILGVEKNVFLQLDIAYEKFKNEVENGQLAIIGGILDIDNTYGNGYGKLHIFKIISKMNKCDLYF